MQVSILKENFFNEMEMNQIFYPANDHGSCEADFIPDTGGQTVPAAAELG